jgi:hypothetical protein
VINKIAEKEQMQSNVDAMQETKMLKNIEEEELVTAIRALVCIEKEVVVLLKCLLVVFVCGLMLAGYVTMNWLN